MKTSNKMSTHIGAAFCRHSCFGASSLPSGFINYHCMGRTALIACRTQIVNNKMPEDNAGVICSRLTSIEGILSTLLATYSIQPIIFC